MPVHPDYPDPRLIPDDVTFEHICEVCGKSEMLTAGEAYKSGWDYPPHMYQWGAISPRTCENCAMNATVWWALAMDHTPTDDLTAEQRQTAARILNELPD